MQDYPFLFLCPALLWSYQAALSISTKVYLGCSFTGTHMQHPDTQNLMRLLPQNAIQLEEVKVYLLYFYHSQKWKDSYGTFWKANQNVKDPSVPTRHEALCWPSPRAKNSNSSHLSRTNASCDSGGLFWNTPKEHQESKNNMKRIYQPWLLQFSLALNSHQFLRALNSHQSPSLYC